MSYLDWRFFPVFDVISPSIAYSGSYHAGLVALSVLVATLAAFVALSGRVRPSGNMPQMPCPVNEEEIYARLSTPV